MLKVYNFKLKTKKTVFFEVNRSKKTDDDDDDILFKLSNIIKHMQCTVL